MKSQITMKDLSDHFGVSLNTVHKALAGKPGVSEETRKKIVAYAKEHGYKRNSLAANLKRKEIRIAVCLPEIDEESRYFYKYVWEGYRDYCREWDDLNLKIREIPYKKRELTKCLVQLNEENHEEMKLDGLLTTPPVDEAGEKAVNSLIEKGICVVFVTEDNEKCARFGVVMGDYYAAGQLMAEQACNLLHKPSNILLLAGDKKKEAHCQAVQGFSEYVEKHTVRHKIQAVYGYRYEDSVEERIGEAIEKEMPECICCAIARGSVKLFHVLKEQNLYGKIPVIANDVFEENVEALESGMVTNLVFKDPHKQAYLATKMLCDMVVRKTKPKKRIETIENILVFKSNLKYYWK